MNKFALTLAVAACAGMVSAGDIFELKSPADLNIPSRVKQNGEVFTMKGKSSGVSTKKSFDVDPAKTYKLSGDVRLAAGKAPNVYISLIPKTATGRDIGAINVMVMKGTETELAAEAKAGDKVLKLKDGTKWTVKNKYPYVAFDVKDAYADLPNFSVLPAVVDSVKKTDAGWEITLQKPLKRAYPAGTKVRQHTAGGAYIYPLGVFKPTAEWKERSGKLSGMYAEGNGGKKFWAGTKKVSVYFFYQGGDADTAVEFKDIEFEVED